MHWSQYASIRDGISGGKECPELIYTCRKKMKNDTKNIRVETEKRRFSKLIPPANICYWVLYSHAGLRPDPRFIALLFRGFSTGIIWDCNSKERYRIASPHQRPAGAQVAPLRCLILHCWHVYSNMGVALIQELCKDFPVLLPVMVFQSNFSSQTGIYFAI